MNWSLSTPVIVSILLAYGLLMTGVSWFFSRKINAETFIAANRDVTFGWAASSMGATWIYGASLFAAASAGYKYGLSGPFHYAFWGGCCLLLFYPWGQRLRALMPGGHTFPEFIRLRHGRFSHAVMGFENLFTGQYGVMVNFTAGASLIALVSDLPFNAALIIMAVVILSYTLISGIRASLVTDLLQLASIVVVAVVVVPLVFFKIGGATAIVEKLATMGDKADFFSLEAFLKQGAPMICLVLAYAFANPAVWQRVWVTRPSVLRKTYLAAGLIYMAVVFGIGTFGFVALLQGLEPLEGSLNNLVPQVAATYLPAALLVPFLLLLIGALFSSADSDLAGLSSIAMTDIWKGYLRPDAGDRSTLWVGRGTLLVTAGLGAAMASFNFDILTLILFAGMLRAACVFPIAASLVWKRTSDSGFALGVIGGGGCGALAFFGAKAADDGASYFAAHPVLAIPFCLIAAAGVVTLVGCLAWPFLGPRISGGLAGAAGLASLAFVFALPGYHLLLASLTSLGSGMLICVGLSLAATTDYDWSRLGRVASFSDDLVSPPTNHREAHPDA